MPDDTVDTGWTEEAREAALAARQARTEGAHERTPPGKTGSGRFADPETARKANEENAPTEHDFFAKKFGKEWEVYERVTAKARSRSTNPIPRRAYEKAKAEYIERYPHSAALRGMRSRDSADGCWTDEASEAARIIRSLNIS